MTARHVFLGITIFLAGAILGTAQTLVVQNFPQLETRFNMISPTPTPRLISPTFTPTPTASPSATPTPTVVPIRHRILSTPTPTI